MGNRHRLLLVEDYGDIAAVVVETLRPAGFCVETAATPTAATRALSNRRFALVLCDGLSAEREAAWQTAQAVLIAARGTPVVLFTAHRVNPAAVAAAGFADLIEKPFDLDLLLARVSALLDG